MKYFLFIFLLSCPVTLSNEIIYTDPVNGAEMVNIENCLTFGFSSAPAINADDLAGNIIVMGSLSGRHRGRVILKENNKKIIFLPDEPFSFNEQVTVRFYGALSKYVTAGSFLENFTFYTTSKKIIYDPVKGWKKKRAYHYKTLRCLPTPCANT